MRPGLVLALIVAVTSLPVRAGSNSTAPGVPVDIPGRSLPVAREHTYRMAGKIRVVMLWVGRDDVGSGVIRWR